MLTLRLVGTELHSVDDSVMVYNTCWAAIVGGNVVAQPAVAFNQEREHGLPILVAELGEDLREVGRMLLLEQIDEVRRRAYAKEAFDGVQHDIELALRHVKGSART